MQTQNATKKMGLALFGVLIYVLGVNLFIVPLGLYTGGLMGACQLLRTVMVEYLHLPFEGIDFAGVIYYVINIPIFIYAFRVIGKEFLLRTLIAATIMTVLLTLIPIPVKPLINEDPLAACLFGGFLSGYGSGLVLQMGSSAGGLDIISLLIIRKKKDFSVGKIYLAVNITLYGACLVLFDVQIVLYSIIVAMASSITIDKIHYQNINVEVTVITKSFSDEMKQEIMSRLGRGVTLIPAAGAYTKEKEEIMYILASKYEVGQLKHIIYRFDPNAFVVVNEGVRVSGNYLKKL